MSLKFTPPRSNVILFPNIFLSSILGDEAMQVDCAECGGKAIIQSRRRFDVKVSHLYCSCKNPECGHTFVMNLSFSHTLSPSGSQARQLMMDFIRALPDAERRQLIAQA